MGKPEVDKELIRDLAALLNETGLTEIEIEHDSHRLRIVRQPAMVAASMAAAPAAGPAAVTVASGPADRTSHPGAITSPMVGTAYRAPEPTAAPFVNIGDRVHAGQPLLIIEAMKTFNEIHSTKEGVVREILFETGSPVEFGDVLMIVE